VPVKAEHPKVLVQAEHPKVPAKAARLLKAEHPKVLVRVDLHQKVTLHRVYLKSRRGSLKGSSKALELPE